MNRVFDSEAGGRAGLETITYEEAEHIEAGVKHIEGGGAYVLDVATLVSSVGRCGGGVAAEHGGGEHSAAEAEHVDEGAL